MPYTSTTLRASPTVRVSTISILWSAGEMKRALLINDYPHAAFDFCANAAIVGQISRTCRTLHRATGTVPIITGQTK